MRQSPFAALTAHEQVCSERYMNIRKDINDLCEEVKGIRTFFITGTLALIGVQFAVIGWLISNYVLKI